MTGLRIRPARPGDASAVSAVLCASIRELCDADHRNDPEAIDRWLANKTPEQVGHMISAGGMFVAIESDRIVAVGAVDPVDSETNTGRISLNYVAPDHRFKGVSRALLSAMEQTLASAGARVGLVTSTATARRFYRSAGWIDAGPGKPGRWIVGFPMTKALDPV